MAVKQLDLSAVAPDVIFSIVREWLETVGTPLWKGAFMKQRLAGAVGKFKRAEPNSPNSLIITLENDKLMFVNPKRKIIKYIPNVPINKSIDSPHSLFQAAKVYASTQIQAAGVLIVAKEESKILTILRSSEVIDPDCWCSPGGKIDAGETPEEAARREVAEEIGFTGDMQLQPIYVYESPVLKFHNFIGIVDKQFMPALNWESSGYAWTKLDDMPHPWHYGLQAIMADAPSKAALISALTTSHKIP